MFENHRKVAFNIASEASYVYILSEQKLIKIAKIAKIAKVAIILKKVKIFKILKMRHFEQFSNNVA